MSGDNLDFLMLHGVLRDPAELQELEGAFGGAAELRRCGALWAVVSPAPLDRASLEARFSNAEATAAIAFAHNRILASLAERSDVAPVALGAVVTAAGLPELISARQSELLAVLERIAGCVEYGAKLHAGVRAEASPAPAASEPEDGRAYLRSLGRNLQRRRDARQSVEELQADVQARLAALAREALELTPGPGPRGRPLFSLALLTARAHVPRLIEEAEGLEQQAAALGLQLELSGPWPAYSFSRAPEAEPV